MKIAREVNIRRAGGGGSLIKGFFRQLYGWTLILPSVILFIMLVWRPILMGISYAFFKLKGTVPVEFVGLKNFIDVITDTNFLQTLLNTVWYVLWSLVIGLPIPFIAAVMVNEMLRGKSFFKLSLYMPVVMPSIVTCLIWRFIYSDGSGGLLNMLRYCFGAVPAAWLSNKSLSIPLIVVTMTWNAFGSTMIVYLASLQGVDKSLYEAARIDGAGFWMRIKEVIMPHMWSIILLNIVRQIIAVFQVTEQPLIMTGGGPNGASTTLGLTTFFYAFRYGQMDKSMAMGVITFLILCGLTFIYFRLDRKING